MLWGAGSADGPVEALACEDVGCVGDPAVRMQQRAGRHDRLGVRPVEAESLAGEEDGHTGVLRCGIGRMGERDLHRTREAGTEIEREQIAEAEGRGVAVEVARRNGRCGLVRGAPRALLLCERGVMRIAVARREKAEVAAGEDACEGGASLGFANRLAPCIDCIFGRIRKERVRLLFTDAFECGEIRLGPAGIVAADGVDDLRRESIRRRSGPGRLRVVRPRPRAPAE